MKQEHVWVHDLAHEGATLGELLDTVKSLVEKHGRDATVELVNYGEELRITSKQDQR